MLIFIETERMVGCQGLGGRRNDELIFNGYRGSVLQSEKISVGNEGCIHNNVNVLSTTEPYT